MHYLIYPISLIWLSLPAFAQQRITQLDGSQDLSLIPGYGIVTTNPLKPEETKGSFYLFEDWRQGDIYLSKKNLVIKNCALRYNLYNRQIEILNQKEVRALYAAQVDSFQCIHPQKDLKQRFVNATQYQYQESTLVGFMEILTDSKIQALAKTEAHLENAEGKYVPALNVGSRTQEVKKEEQFYLARDNKLFEIKNKKDITVCLTDQAEALDNYIKENNLKPNKRKEDLIRVIDFYHSLVN